MATQQEHEQPTTQQSSTTGSGSERDKQQAGSEQPLTREPGTSGTERRETRSERGAGPFSKMRRFSDEIDRVFDDFYRGVGDHWPLSTWRGRTLGPSGDQTWWPAVEVYERDDKLIVQADIPGLKKDDVRVEVRGGELYISGERRTESEQKERGYYRSERSYGSFSRAVPLPEGAKPETASASFENGVLRIEMEAPQNKGKGRQIEIREGAAH